MYALIFNLAKNWHALFQKLSNSVAFNSVEVNYLTEFALSSSSFERKRIFKCIH